MITDFSASALVGSVVQESDEIFRYIPVISGIEHDTILVTLDNHPSGPTVADQYSEVVTTTITFENDIQDVDEKIFMVSFMIDEV